MCIRDRGYYGLQADMLDLAYGYIPRQDFYEGAGGARFGPNPERAYPGDPAAMGFYCFAGALCDGANTYLEKAGDVYKRQTPWSRQACCKAGQGRGGLLPGMRKCMPRGRKRLLFAGGYAIINNAFKAQLFRAA